VEHKALGKWLFPGGHLEDEDETLMRAALRELAEETGIDPALVTPVSPVPLHIDVHPIPANPAKDEPDHQHFDFRFLFRSWTTPGSSPTRSPPSPCAAASWPSRRADPPHTAPAARVPRRGGRGLLLPRKSQVDVI
jgi:8-oxo-dGTP pyrophosphatase MutT (NUDIX family)